MLEFLLTYYLKEVNKFAELRNASPRSYIMGDKEYDNPFSAYIVLNRNKKMKGIISKRMNELQINSLKHETLSKIRISQSLSKSIRFTPFKKKLII